MRCTVLLFAQLRDAVGAGTLTIELPPEATVADALERLGREHPAIADFRGRLAVAVDERYAAPGTALSEGCRVALIPPVSGG